MNNTTMSQSHQGSVAFENAISKGYVLGTPRYASFAPHHQRHEGGAWTYENMYDPRAEIAFEWLARKKSIIIEGVWIAAYRRDFSSETEMDDMETGHVFIRTNRGGDITDVLKIRMEQIVEAPGWDYEGEETKENYSAVVSGRPNADPDEYPYRVGRYAFPTEKKKNAFLADVESLMSSE